MMKKCSNVVDGTKCKAEITLIYILDVTMYLVYLSLEELH